MFWRFFAPISDFGIDVFQSDEHGGAARPRRLFDEAGNAVTERVDLQHQPDAEAVFFAQLDQPVEDRLPVLVAGEIVVGDEEARDPLRSVGAHDAFDVVRRAVARLAALHVDDGAEAALERAAAAGVEARIMAGDAGDRLARQDRIGRRRHVRQIVHVVVDRLRGSSRHVAQEDIHAAFGFACIERDAEVERLLEVRRQLGKHGEAPADMEAADRDRNVGGAELAGKIERARELVRLHPDQADKTAARLADFTDRALDVDDGVALVIGLDLDIRVRAERFARGAFGDQAVHAGEAIGGDGRAPPLDDVAVRIIVRRFDQDRLEPAACHGTPG